MDVLIDAKSMWNR